MASGGRQRDCDHCGLPVPTASVEEGASEQFCCPACRTVHGVIHDLGLEGFYRYRELAGEERARAVTSGRAYGHFDDATFQELYTRPAGGGLRRTSLYLEGVHCGGCVWLVERLPHILDGVHQARLDLGRSRVDLLWDPHLCELSGIARRLDSLGYPAHAYRHREAEEIARREQRSLLIRMAVSGAIAGNVMLLASALYSGSLQGMEARFESFFRWISLLLSVPVVIWGGGVFLRGAWGALKSRMLHIDLPISIGIVTGFLWGATNTIRGEGQIYFDSVTLLIFLLLAGRLLQRLGQRRAREAADLLSSFTPRSARRIETDGVREVPLEVLVPGDRVRVRSGETIPGDGLVVRGRTALDASVLTGEPRPVEVEEGGLVSAGFVNVGGAIDVRVEVTGERTRVGQILQMVEEYARRRAPILGLVDRISGWFVAAVIALAAATALLWLAIDPSRAVDNAVALLIVTCPCALGLATPLAVSSALGQAARRGVLIKGGDVFERLARPGRIWLDKTGTITTGRLELAEWHGDEQIKDLVAALEGESSHPLARAFQRATQAARRPPVTAVAALRGGGIEGRVAGRHVLAGSPAAVAARLEEERSGGSEDLIEGLTDPALTPVIVAVDGRPAAVAGFGDPLRPSARALVERIRRAGWRVGILSGDHPRVVAAVARRLGLDGEDCRGGVTPEGKLGLIEKEAARGTVVMVGDGVNDAAALAAATTGIAIQGGAEAALSAADVFVARGRIEGVADLLEGSRRALRIIRRNLLFSLAYNLVGAGSAAAGLIHPLLAAVLMPISSLTVIASSYRARAFPAAEEASGQACRETAAPAAGPGHAPGIARSAGGAP